MKVIGLTSELSEQARKTCRSEFTAWLSEVRNGGWQSLEELQLHYPAACRTGGNELFFPLKSGGPGILATWIARGDPSRDAILRLRCFQVAPAADGASSRRTFPALPQGNMNHEIPATK